MTRPGKTAGVLALLAALLLGGSASARDPERDQEILERLRKLERQVATLREESKLTNEELRLLNAEMKRLNERIDRIRALLRRQGTTTSRTSRSFDPDTTTTSTIRLVNRLGSRATVTIDGVDYTVAAYKTRTLRDQPVGTVTYSVTADNYGVGRSTRTRLRANERLTLTIDEP